MACCIIGLLILATVGRLRRALGMGGGDSEMLFAPVAQRPAPGETLAPVTAAVPDQPIRTAVLRYCALGIAIGTVATPLLVWTGIAENTATIGAWLLRTAAYLILAAAALALSRAVVVGRWIAGPGWLLIVVGAVVFETGLLDMHAFRLFEIDHGDVAADIVFHNIGPALALIGAGVLLYGFAGRTMTSRRSSRSTVTSALPCESAVTESSTPPVTT
jgi:hypothetical protein